MTEVLTILSGSALGAIDYVISVVQRGSGFNEVSRDGGCDLMWRREVEAPKLSDDESDRQAPGKHDSSSSLVTCNTKLSHVQLQTTT